MVALADSDKSFLIKRTRSCEKKKVVSAKYSTTFLPFFNSHSYLP